MLRMLRLENFRRYEHAQIELGDEDRTIVVSGRNGAGKSTLIEAITYALVGEGRHGNRHLDRLVRRGAELEGMEVELCFDIDGASYRVVRRRDNGVASAVLSVNDQPLVEGTRQVTAAIEDLLGMDSQGIRLAVVAQQKELDYLLRLGGPARAKAIGRLLRLDAIAKARDEARGEYRDAHNALESIPQHQDLKELSQAVAQAQASHARAQASEAECRAQVAALEAELAASAHLEESYQLGRERLARAQATLAAAENEVERAKAALEAIVVPEEPAASSADLAVLERRAAELEHSIAAAEAAATLQQQRESTRSELNRAVARIDQLDNLLAGGGRAELEQRVAQLRQQASATRETIAADSARREELREQLGGVRADIDRWTRRLATIEELGAVCDTCGQDIAADHVEHQTSAAREQLDEVRGRYDDIVAQGTELAGTIAKQEAELSALEGEIAATDSRASRAASAEGERDELQRRITMYRQQLERLGEQSVDIDELYAQKGALTLDVMQAKERERRLAEREQAISRQQQASLNYDAAVERRDAAYRAVEGAALDADLAAAYQQRQALNEQHRGELEMLSVLAAATAQEREREQLRQNELRHANELAGARVRQQRKGTDAANAQRVLTEVEKELGGQIRPMLEGLVGDLLARMSNGRFTSVQIGADYDMTVLDGGSYRPLSELSGGEADLAALALRLGLADVVCSRRGGVGFLILDEPFGSQDGERREAILTALQSLRGTYGQIWCISHVGGIEDAADRVLEIDIDENGLAEIS